jgi:hypothetical protein
MALHNPNTGDIPFVSPKSSFQAFAPCDHTDAGGEENLLSKLSWYSCDIGTIME